MMHKKQSMFGRTTLRAPWKSLRARIRGFTLIETLIAISVLMIAVIAPMTLATDSLAAAYYARDQIIASNLAQEGIEVVRSVRDGNILTIAEGGNTTIFNGIPSTNGQPFTVDALMPASQAMQLCPQAVCLPLQTNGTEYSQNYAAQSGWTSTIFTRTVTAKLINSNPNELRISVTVSWIEGAYQQRSVTLDEDLYQWIAS